MKKVQEQGLEKEWYAKINPHRGLCDKKDLFQCCHVNNPKNEATFVIIG